MTPARREVMAIRRKLGLRLHKANTEARRAKRSITLYLTRRQTHLTMHLLRHLLHNGCGEATRDLLACIETQVAAQVTGWQPGKGL